MRFISTKEASEFSRLSERQINEAIADGRLPALKQQTGRRKSIKTVFPRHLVKYMAEHMTVKSEADIEDLSQALEAWIVQRDEGKDRRGEDEVGIPFRNGSANGLRKGSAKGL